MRVRVRGGVGEGSAPLHGQLGVVFPGRREAGQDPKPCHGRGRPRPPHIHCRLHVFTSTPTPQLRVSNIHVLIMHEVSEVCGVSPGG